MEAKSLVFLTLLVVAATVVTAIDVRHNMMLPGLFGLAEEQKEEESVAVEDKREEDADEQAMREIAMNLQDAMLEKREEEKRGIFSCARMFKKCHALKHCCGKLRCNRKNIFSKGICLQYV